MIIKKKFTIEDLDCAHCAAKMEERIKKIKNVENATVSFILQELTIEAEETEFDKIIKEAVKVCKKVEPDCRIIL